MRMLSCLFAVALSASPALAADGAPESDAGAAPAVTAATAQAQPAAPDAQPKKKRTLACPACRTNGMPSFAIRPAEGNGQASAMPGAAAGAAAPSGNAASQPPVNFSFSASGDTYANRNRYSGGVYMAAPF